MKKLSRVYKRDRYCFRYDYDNCLVQWVSKPSKEELADNEEWIRDRGKPLWDIEAGYIVHECVGLRPENWKNVETRNEYLDGWIFELEETFSYEMAYEGL